MTDVTQADRDAAKDVMFELRGYPVTIGPKHWLAQAFARHRLNNRPQPEPVAPRPYPHATPGFVCQEYFGFDGGSLTIRTAGDRAGSGWLCFSEDDLEWDQDDETGKDYRICNVSNSDLIFIRDKLNEVFPAAPGDTTTTSAVGELVEGLQEALAWHEGELKALSKQPPSPSLEWPKHQHRERIDALSDLLAKHGGAK